MNTFIKSIALLAATLLVSCNVLAVGGTIDTDGVYSINEVRVNGSLWTDETTTLASNTLYAVEVDISYDAAEGLDSPYDFAEEQLADMWINDQKVWSGIDSYADVIAQTPKYDINGDPIGYQVDKAEWTLTGGLEYIGLVSLEGTYSAHFDRLPGDSTDNGFGKDVTQLVTLVAGTSSSTLSVSEPASYALIGIGLLVLCWGRRKSQSA